MIIQKYYHPSDTYENFNTETNVWTTSRGKLLRSPENYNTNTEGYTPFGDE